MTQGLPGTDACSREKKGSQKTPLFSPSFPEPLEEER